MNLPRIVTQLQLDNDRRSDRPLASDLILSFWKYTLEQPVRSLRGIIYQIVEEQTTKAVKEQVYRSLHQMRSTPVSLSRHGDEAERDEFDRVRKETKLGRCANTIATEYIEMKEVRARVTQFDFMPQDRRGELFHLMVEIEHGR